MNEITLNRFAKVFVIFILLLTIFNQSNTSSFALDSGRVDVGIIFGANNQFPIGVTSAQGFVFGSEVDTTFTPILDLSNYTSLTIYKDGYYESGSQNLVTTPQGYYANSQVMGGYHLQIGTVFATYEQALETFVKLSGRIENAYLVYDDGWRIFVGMYVNQLEAESQLNLVVNALPEFGVTITEPNFGRVILMSDNKPVFSYDSSEQEYVFKTMRFTVNSVEYRSDFIVRRFAGSDFTFINRVTVEEYLYGVVPKEMSAGWPLEALKAQAIASRNFVLTASNKYVNYGFDVCNTVNSQVYGGYSAEKPLSNQAVDETAGYALVYDDKIIPMYFHAHSGGITDNSENIWSSELPYIRQTLDLYSIGYPNTDWSVTLNHADIEAKLIIAGYNVGSLKSIEILERYDSGRVAKMSFVGTLSTATIAKDKIRSVLGSSSVKSLLFSFDPSTAVTDLSTIGNVTSTNANTNNTPSGSSVSAGSQAITPVVVRTNAGIYATFVDSSHLTIVENGKTTTVSIDKSALRNAKDIYTSTANISVPYVYSNSESFDMSSGNVILYGHGYGHGLGMSQWGAKKMAEEGKTFEEILLYYYKDTQLVRR